MRALVLIVLVGVIAIKGQEEVVNKEFLDGYNKFTTNVYNELKSVHSDDFVVSPLSVDIILALAEYGSKGKTSQQLVKGLSLPENKEKLKEAISSLAPRLNVNETYTLTSANKIYVKQGYQLLDKFKQFAEEVYHAEVENVNFEENKVAAEIMNKWVEGQTLQKIKDLINADDLDKDTRTVLINALYFRGEWLREFDKSKTKQGSFYLDNTATTEVPLMEIRDTFKYHDSDKLDAKIVVLPYVGNDVTLTIVLPNNKDGLAALESKVEDVIDASYLKFEHVHVKLPKFKIETNTEFKPILQNLGIVDAFEDIAEFPEITGQLLKISKVVQKAVIEVDESGTTAAAATAVIMPVIRSGVLPRHTKEFIADHPFIFVLKYKSVVLFVGHYTGK